MINKIKRRICFSFDFFYFITTLLFKLICNVHSIEEKNKKNDENMKFNAAYKVNDLN